MKKKEKTTFEERIVSLIIFSLSAFITSFVIWLFIAMFIGKAGEVFNFSFNFVIYSTVIFAVLAFLSPKNALTCIGWVWKKIDNFIKLLKNENGGW